MRDVERDGIDRAQERNGIFHFLQRPNGRGKEAILRQSDGRLLGGPGGGCGGWRRGWTCCMRRWRWSGGLQTSDEARSARPGRRTAMKKGEKETHVCHGCHVRI
jgi:hypothetical protein